MRVKKDSVVVIKGINYSEKDRILTLYGKHRGKFSVLAKGIRGITSKNRGNMQTLGVSNISYYEGKGIPILMETESVMVQDYAGESIKNIERVLFLLNKFMGEDEENEKIYKSLISVIKRGFDDETVSRFRLIFLQEIGLLAGLGNCMDCGERSDLYFNPDNLEVRCKGCNGEGVEMDNRFYTNRKIIDGLDRYIDKLYADMF